MRRLTLLGVGCAALTFLAAPARADLDFELFEWFPQLDASARQSANPLDTIDARNDLGVRRENFPELRVKWQPGRKSELRLSYTNWHWRGDNVITRPFTFDNTTFLVNERLLSSTNLNVAKGTYHWQPFVWRRVQLGLLFNVSAIWGDLTITGVNSGTTESVSGAVPLPTVGASLNIQPSDVVGLYGEFSGIAAGEYGNIWELEAGVRLKPDKYFYAFGGWRIVDMDLKDPDTNDFVKFKLDGPFFGVNAGF